MAREIFLDSSKVAEIEKWSSLGITTGTTSNQMIMMKDGVKASDLDTQVKKMCEASPGCVSVELTSSEASVEEMMVEARRLRAIDRKVVVKVPIIPGSTKSLEVIAELKQEQIPVNVTAMMTWEQMRMAAEATHGFDESYISLFWARSLDSRDARVEDSSLGTDHEINSHPARIVRATLDLINDNGWTNPRIIIGSIRNPRQAGEALASGAHIVTITPSVLEAMLTDEMTTKTVQQFDQAWEDMKK